jgi:hypothetical protein
MYPSEVAGEETRILSAARGLAREGSYLVMFQTYSAYDLGFSKTVGQATLADKPFFYGLPLGQQIAELLPGQKIVCGPFTGVYQPVVLHPSISSR